MDLIARVGARPSERDRAGTDRGAEAAEGSAKGKVRGLFDADRRSRVEEDRGNSRWEVETNSSP
jgi:hypothetical protein